MYTKSLSCNPICHKLFLFNVFGVCILATIGMQPADAQSSVIRKITKASEHLELNVHSSRILTLEKPIPRMVVNNPELVTVTALSTNQVQIAATNVGVTQINFWDEDGNVFTVDISIYGDVRELQLALKRIFPESSVKAVQLSHSLVLEGFVEKPEAVSPIIRLAEDYSPKVVNNINVGGVQQVLLKVKVMEVSRTKLRQLGFDWAHISGADFITSSVSDILSSVATIPPGIGGVAGGINGGTVHFGVVDGNNAFLGFIDALQRNDVAKVLADPTITAVSGRSSFFHSGGEFPIVVPSGLNQVTIEYKRVGTEVHFLPIVLGNGNIRLEVRPKVSEFDDTRAVEIDGFFIPALKSREVDTAVEMKAGQTLALAGLVQSRTSAFHRGIPFISDLPYVGGLFRKVREETNEIELLIMVTPELVDPLDPHEVPPCGPGMESVSPRDAQLYFNGHIEMPACGPCGPNCQGCSGPNCQGSAGACGATTNVPAPGMIMATDSGYMPEGGYQPGAAMQESQLQPAEVPQQPAEQLPEDAQPEPMALPEETSQSATGMPAMPPSPVPGRTISKGTIQATKPLAGIVSPTLQVSQPDKGPWDSFPFENTTVEDGSGEGQTLSLKGPISHDQANQKVPETLQIRAIQKNLPKMTTHTPGLIGPIGYDVK
jgi:pilus assembly protein CpaC